MKTAIQWVKDHSQVILVCALLLVGFGAGGYCVYLVDPVKPPPTPTPTPAPSPSQTAADQTASAEDQEAQQEHTADVADASAAHREAVERELDWIEEETAEVQDDLDKTNEQLICIGQSIRSN